MLELSGPLSEPHESTSRAKALLSECPFLSYPPTDATSPQVLSCAQVSVTQFDVIFREHRVLTHQ